VDVARRHHWLGLITPSFFGIKTTLDSALAIADDFAVTSTHSKCSFWLSWMTLTIAIKPRSHGHFEFFYPQIFSASRLFKD
jgi:hypothetical protein